MLHLNKMVLQQNWDVHQGRQLAGCERATPPPSGFVIDTGNPNNGGRMSVREEAKRTHIRAYPQDRTLNKVVGVRRARWFG